MENCSVHINVTVDKDGYVFYHGAQIDHINPDRSSEQHRHRLAGLTHRIGILEQIGVPVCLLNLYEHFEEIVQEVSGISGSLLSPITWSAQEEMQSLISESLAQMPEYELHEIIRRYS